MALAPERSSARTHGILTASPAHQAFLLARTVFTIAPIVFGLDKFANVLVDWPLALWRLATGEESTGRTTHG